MTKTMDDVRMGIDRKTHRLREENLARKRNQEYKKQLFWNDITNYYKTWDVQTSKYNVWASQPQTPVNVEREKENEKKNLEERRSKLRKLLAEEQQQYEEELKEYTKQQKKIKNPYKAITDEDMKTMNLELMLKEEEAKRHKATIERYHRQRTSHPLLHEIEKKKNQETMKNCWIEQIKEKESQKENEREMMQKLEEEIAKQREIEEEHEKELVRKKQEEMKELKNFLLNQMEEVKKKDELTEQLKLEEQREIKLKIELEKIAVRRNQIENQRRSKELRSFLRHQYQLQLKRKTHEIQEELKEDKRLIDEITQCLEQQELENSKIREETRKEIDRANAMLAEYTKLEKQREREMEFMFFEEARKMWQKQEANWNMEQEARNNLMRDVLVTIQKQVKEKLQISAEKHKMLIQEKEDLLKSIENVNQQLKDAEKDATQKKKEYMAQLQQQIKEKEIEKEYEEQEKQNELREQQTKLKEEEEEILNELRKMSTVSNPTIPKRHPFW